MGMRSRVRGRGTKESLEMMTVSRLVAVALLVAVWAVGFEVV